MKAYGIRLIVFDLIPHLPPRPSMKRPSHHHSIKSRNLLTLWIEIADQTRIYRSRPFNARNRWRSGIVAKNARARLRKLLPVGFPVPERRPRPRRLLFGSLTSRLSDLAVGTERRRVASRVSWIPEIYRMIL